MSASDYPHLVESPDLVVCIGLQTPRVGGTEPHQIEPNRHVGNHQVSGLDINTLLRKWRHPGVSMITATLDHLAILKAPELLESEVLVGDDSAFQSGNLDICISSKQGRKGCHHVFDVQRI